eukprot:m.1304568 g.1304568  ORF g.1304568 m.1304568 type:complete len:552 (+) comp24812_c0_seq14:315-1970(+)
MGRRRTPPSDTENGADATTNGSPTVPATSPTSLADQTMSSYTEHVAKKHRNLSKRLVYSLALVSNDVPLQLDCTLAMSLSVDVGIICLFPSSTQKNLVRIEETLKECPGKKVEKDQLDALAKKGELEYLSSEFESLKIQFTNFDKQHASTETVEKETPPATTSASLSADDMRHVSDFIVAAAAANNLAISSQQPAASDCIRQILAHGNEGALCANTDSVSNVLMQYVQDRRVRVHKTVTIAGFKAAVVRQSIEKLVAAATKPTVEIEAQPSAEGTEFTESDTAGASGVAEKKSRNDRNNRTKRKAREVSEKSDAAPTTDVSSSTTGAAATEVPEDASLIDRKPRGKKGPPAAKASTEESDTKATAEGEGKPTKQPGNGRRKTRQPKTDGVTNPPPAAAAPNDASAPADVPPARPAGNKRPRNSGRKRNGGPKGGVTSDDGGASATTAHDGQKAADVPEIVFLGPSVVQSKQAPASSEVAPVGQQQQQQQSTPSTAQGTSATDPTVSSTARGPQSGAVRGRGRGRGRGRPRGRGGGRRAEPATGNGNPVSSA